MKNLSIQEKTNPIMRITFIIYSLSSGGAERVMSIMANYWVAKGWAVTLLTFEDKNSLPFYKLDNRICHIPLDIAVDSSNSMIAIWNNLQRICILRSAISDSKPDAVISFMNTVNILTLLATRWLNIPVLVSERNNPASYHIGRIWQYLRHWTYQFADRIVVQTQKIQNYFSPQLQAHACIIPNPVVLPQIKKMSERVSDKRLLIAMGRFEYQKGFDLLIQAIAKLRDRYPEWTLTILGEGTLRPQLESLRNQLGLTERIHLPGRVKNPYEYLQQADLFVMSSRYEGFPNALCEAMACGLPVISCDCPTGPREIIRDNVDGILVPTEDLSALAAAMERLMSDEQERKRLGANALDITHRFSLESVMEMWEKLIEKVIKEKRLVIK